MKKVIAGILILILVIAGILFFHVLRVEPRQMQVTPVAKISLDSGALFTRLSQAITYQTLANEEDSNANDSIFKSFHEFLRTSYPLVFQQLEQIKSPEFGNALVFKWNGKSTGMPLLFLAHQDVVPVDDNSKWKHPPFTAYTDETFVYGRGTLDDKCGVLGTLEAISYLLSKGFQPSRTLYFMFGADEETGGRHTASRVAQWFGKQSIRFESIMDEGGSIVNQVVPGVKAPVALIGVAEKGYASVSLSVSGEGGHSSMPPPSTAAGLISAAVTRLEQNQFPQQLTPITKSMFDFLMSELDFGSRLAFSNTWLFENVILRKMAAKNSTNAATRTTTAVTMMNAGTKDNVLPVNASAIVNFRILPGQSTAEVLEHVRSVVNDSTIKVEFSGHRNEPTAISDTASFAFRTINRSVREVFPEALVAPYMLIGATDSKHFTGLSDQIFRFLPIYMEAEDLKRIHGTDERIRKDNYENLVRFYVRYFELN